MNSGPRISEIDFAINRRCFRSSSEVDAGRVTYARSSPIVPNPSTFECNRRRVRKIFFTGCLIVAAFACIELTGCATNSAERASPDDPFEPMNRAVLDVNTSLDRAVIRPVAEFYRDVVPPFVRDRIRSMIDNLTEPRIFANDLLQFRINAAGITFARFVFNSTFGLAGMFDVAKEHDLPQQSGDF